MNEINVIYGAGKFWESYAEWLIPLFDIKYVCDRDTCKQGNYIKGIKCISIDELLDLNNAKVYIGIENKDIAADVKNMLIEKGITVAEFSSPNKKGSEIYLWGTRYECQVYDWLITQNTEYRVVGYVTHLVEEIGMDNVNRKPVISLSKAENDLYQEKVEGIIALTDFLSFDVVSRQTLSDKLLFHEGYYIAPANYLNRYKKRDLSQFDIKDLMIHYSEQNRLGSLQFMVTAHCNLNCRLCTHFAGLVEKEETYTYDQFCKDIDWAKQNFEVDYLDIWGVKHF